jgi:hypothetical protein
MPYGYPMTALAHTTDNAVECTRTNGATTKFRCPTLSTPTWATEHDDAGTRDSDGARIIGRLSETATVTRTIDNGRTDDDQGVHLLSALYLTRDGIEVADPVIVLMGPGEDLHYTPAQARALAAALTQHADLLDPPTN